MKISEKFLKGATGAAYFTGLLMEFFAVAALEADVISAFSFWLMVSAGAILSAGALFCARAAAEFVARKVTMAFAGAVKERMQEEKP